MVKPFSFGGDKTPKERRKASQKQENRWAKKVDGKTQAGSGAVWSSKGDVKAGGHFIDDLTAFLYENKQTENKGFRVTTDLWNEIRDKAIKTEGKLPAMQIELEIGTPRPTRLVVLDEQDFLALLDFVKNIGKC